MTARTPLPENLDRAARLLASGGLVAFPTETVYGLGANALDETAVARIYAVKQRPRTSPLIVHVPTPEAAHEVVAEWPEEAQRLAEAFWPGPLTLVLPRSPRLPDLLTAGGPYVGVRVPGHPVARALLEAAGVPVAAPSANRFMQLSPTTAEHVREGLGDAVDAIVDGGPCSVGIESTVLALYPDGPVLLRPGSISRDRLEAVLGRPVALPSMPSQGEAHAAPGMHRRHYSPRTRTLVALPGVPLPVGRGAVVSHRLDDFSTGPDVRRVSMPSEPTDYAHQLYATLHALDTEGLDWIGLDLPPQTAEWQAVRDRLTRAAAD
jgi:L-threonylcarbamoyladenylate synthase